MLTAMLAGLLTGLSLIVAIGAQNAFVLRQGLAREHVGLVVTICALADVLLINAGVAGIGFVVERASWLIDVIRWAGVAFLIWYGVSSLRRALRPEHLTPDNAAASSARAVGFKALALTLLNPHVYLDTVLLLGSIAAHHGQIGKWWFALGATSASILWFSTLGFGARRAARFFADPRAWRVLDVVIGLTMLAIAWSLARGA